MIRPSAVLTLFFCALFAHSSASAIMLGQTDDFQDGTAMNWIHGSPASMNPPINVADAGPGGAGDHALLNNSTGSAGPGSRMAMLNETQWTGDYNAAGVTQIDIMMRADPAGAPLTIRLGFEENIGERAVSEAIAVPHDGNWHSFSYDISPSALTVVGGLLSAEDILSNVMELRIFSSDNPVPSWQGDTIAANLYVDNIVAVPEPGVGVTMISLIALLALRRRMR